MPDNEGTFHLGELLSTASTIANYLAAPDVTIEHLRDAVAVLLGEKDIRDLGRPLSPLVRRPDPGATRETREFAQRWFTYMTDVTAELTPEEVAELRAELAPPSPPPSLPS